MLLNEQNLPKSIDKVLLKEILSHAKEPKTWKILVNKLNTQFRIFASQKI